MQQNAFQNREPISAERLRFHMPPAYRNCPIHIFDSLESTNTYAKQLAQEHAPHGTVVLAKQQTSGRGRLGRSFFSPRNGIYLSVIIKPATDLSSYVLITSAAAVAAAESIHDICGVDTGIKWVNDVYADGRKICGILVEGVTNSKSNRVESLVVGIGVNTCLEGFPEELMSTAGAIEGDYSRSALAASIITRVLDFSASIEDRDFMDAYRKRSLVIGKTVTVYRRFADSEGDYGRPARVTGIDENGGLCVLYPDGTRETLTSGEISIRL